MLLAKRCEHCHGAEGFSPVTATPNLAGMNTLAIWKQLEDFRTHKRRSRTMEPIAESLSPRDVADVVSYYAELPIFLDPQDNRVFPQVAAECQSCGDGVSAGYVWRRRARHSALPGLSWAGGLPDGSSIARNAEWGVRFESA